MTSATEPVVDSPPLSNVDFKKHNARPCRLYQGGQCPRSASECNYAHVIEIKGANRKRDAICRYYLAGHCSNGLWCRYRHDRDPVIAMPKPCIMSTTPYSMVPYHADDSPVSPFLMELVLTSPPSSAESVFSPFRWGDSPLRDDGSTSPSSQASSQSTSLSKRSRRSRSSAKAARQRALKYKTQPCLYFNTPSGCAKGDNCTFIHEQTKSEEQDLPASPEKRNFYPITWRIISGGVLLGTEMTKVSPEDAIHEEDSHETEFVEEEPAVGVDEDESEDEDEIEVQEVEADTCVPPSRRRLRAISFSEPCSPRWTPTVSTLVEYH